MTLKVLCKALIDYQRAKNKSDVRQNHERYFGLLVEDDYINLVEWQDSTDNPDYKIIKATSTIVLMIKYLSTHTD
jgi:hypothetical protein